MSKSKTPKTSHAVDRDYLLALEHFWQGRPHTAVEHLSKVLAENPEHPWRYAFYRLWIEILVKRNERETLKFLSDHVFNLSVIEGQLHSSFMFIRGLVHLELDEIWAAHLFARIQPQDVDPYYGELKARLLNRHGIRSGYQMLWNNISSLSDYYVLRQAAEFAFMRGRRKIVTEILHRIYKLYPHAPIRLEFELFQAQNRHNWAHAIAVAQALIQKYPARSDYRIQLAYAAYANQEYDLAQKQIEAVMSYGSEYEVEAMALQAQIIVETYNQQPMAPSEQQKFLIHLKKAISLLEEDGMNSRLFQEKLAALKDEGGATEHGIHHGSQPQLWAYVVDAPTCYTLRESDKQAIAEFQFSIDAPVKANDFIFVFAKDYVDSNKLRFVALYRINEDPFVDAVNGLSVNAQLVERPEVTVPLELSPKLNMTNSRMSPISSDVLRIIDEQLVEFLDESVSLNDLVGTRDVS